MSIPSITRDVAIIGAGTAGLFALREVKKQNKSFIVIDTGPLGTTCARVGCMPSKIALKVAKDWHNATHETQRFGAQGQEHLSLNLDLAWQYVREQRDYFSGKTEKNSLRSMGEHYLQGRARFVNEHTLEISRPEGDTLEIVANNIIVATGSSPWIPESLYPFKEDIITTDQLFELAHLPRSIAVIGLGVIGLEMGIVLAKLGVQVIGLELGERLAGVSDPVVQEHIWAHFSAVFPMHKHTPFTIHRETKGLRIECNNETYHVEKLLVATGRRPNTSDLGLEHIGLNIEKNAPLVVDLYTQQLTPTSVYAVGDVTNARPLMHEAVLQGMAAGFNVGKSINQTKFLPKTPLQIAFTDPDIVTVGQPYHSLNMDEVVIGQSGGCDNGRSRIVGGLDNIIRLYVQKGSGQLLGASMMMTSGEHLGHLLAWAIQRGATVTELISMPFYHPVIEECLQGAIENAIKQLGQVHSFPLGTRPIV